MDPITLTAAAVAVNPWKKWGIRLFLLVFVAFFAVVGYERLREHWIDLGRAEVQAAWDVEKAKANEAAADRGAKASNDFSSGKRKSEIRYIETIKEVEKYVPAENTTCPYDAEFVRLYNDPFSGKGRASAGSDQP